MRGRLKYRNAINRTLIENNQKKNLKFKKKIPKIIQKYTVGWTQKVISNDNVKC